MKKRYDNSRGSDIQIHSRDDIAKYRGPFGHPYRLQVRYLICPEASYSSRHYLQVGISSIFFEVVVNFWTYKGISNASEVFF